MTVFPAFNYGTIHTGENKPTTEKGNLQGGFLEANNFSSTGSTQNEKNVPCRIPCTRLKKILKFISTNKKNSLGTNLFV